jgi:hypothetical protein
VVVGAVDESDISVDVAERLCCRQPAEAATDYDNLPPFARSR